MAEQLSLDLPGARILNRAQDWGNNYDIGPLLGTAISFEKETGSRDADRWIIENYQDGYRIYNKGSKNWATSVADEVLGTPRFTRQACKWWIRFSGNQQEYWIQEPWTGGRAWTLRAAPGGGNTVFLDRLSNDNVHQRLTFSLV